MKNWSIKSHWIPLNPLTHRSCCVLKEPKNLSHSRSNSAQPGVARPSCRSPESRGIWLGFCWFASLYFLYFVNFYSVKIHTCIHIYICVCIYIHNYMYTVYLIAASARLFQDTRDFRHGSVFPLQSRALNFFDLSSCSVAIKLRSLDSPETGASGGNKTVPTPDQKRWEDGFQGHFYLSFSKGRCITNKQNTVAAW